MVSEATTLYKIMILYMLRKVNFPLTNDQMTNFFVSKEYTQYFTLQEVIAELEESNLIHSETIRNQTSYELTSEGEDAVYYFGNRLSAEIKEDIDAYLRENKMKFRSETSVVSNYYKSASQQEYVVECEIKESKSTRFTITLTVPTEEQAEHVCNQWREENQAIYAYVMHHLLL